MHKYVIKAEPLCLDSLKLTEKSTNAEDEDDLIIERFFPDLPFADLSKLTQLLKQIAQDDSLSYEKKQNLCVK